MDPFIKVCTTLNDRISAASSHLWGIDNKEANFSIILAPIVLAPGQSADSETSLDMNYSEVGSGVQLVFLVWCHQRFIEPIP